MDVQISLMLIAVMYCSYDLHSSSPLYGWIYDACVNLIGLNINNCLKKNIAILGLTEWTSHEAQLRIDDYQSELSPVYIHLACQCLKSIKSKTHAQDGVFISACPSPAALKVQGQSHHTPDSSVPLFPLWLKISQNRLKRRRFWLTWFTCFRIWWRICSNAPTQGGSFQRRFHDRRPREASCRICNDTSHNTISHCLRDSVLPAFAVAT